MKKIGTHFGRDVFYSNIEDINYDLLIKSWICLAISDDKYDGNKFDRIVRKSIKNGLLEFKAQGKYGELLHEDFDEIMSKMSVDENLDLIHICTTGNNKSDLDNVFWESFYCTALPDTKDLDVLCISLDGIDRTKYLKELINKFDKGWIPESND